MAGNKVIILGGGVAGLSAAHELAERGFVVEIYEKADAFGGKAKSNAKPNSGVGGRKNLPGEHGFGFSRASTNTSPIRCGALRSQAMRTGCSTTRSLLRSARSPRR